MLFDPKWKQPEVTSPVANILIRARAVISAPDSWCQAYEDGHAICAVHAIQRVLHSNPNAQELEGLAVDALAEAIGIPVTDDTGPWVGNWNDTHTHAEVLAAFDKAIAAAS